MITTTSRYIFSDILKRGTAAGKLPGKTVEARTWYRNVAQSINSISRARLLSEKTQIKNSILPGGMYMFAYEAKHKDTLPYYDRFPIIFPVKLLNDGFLGLNFHYLQPSLRANLMDSLYKVASDKNITEKTKIQLSYELLNSIVRHNLFKPCLKRYLYSHFRSKFIYVEPDSWDVAIFLPTANFQGASQSKVWADSRKIL